MFYQILYMSRILYKLSLKNIFCDDRNKLPCIQTKLINHITSVLIVKTKLSLQEYVKGIQNLLIPTSYRGSISRNAYFATVH